ncbi:MAG TPA: cyanophycinase [Candidatus Limnocylindria bacterium]|nr:cyanophycinase [Candidatus Limnocylindria bacterium]
MPSSPRLVVPGGPLVVIGGAEDKLGRTSVLRRFVDLAGGVGARIALCASASSMGEEVTRLYETVFRSLGAEAVVPASPLSRVAADDPELVSTVTDSTGIFFTGGNQLKLSQIVTGTAFGDAVVTAHRQGRTIGGTSAGASVLSEHMVAFGTSGATPKNRIAQLAKGLGLLPGVVVDQHFGQRNRYGRLLSLVAQSPSLLGMGVDEDTAAVITGARVLEVIGRGSVFVVDGGRAVSNAASASRTKPLMVSGAVLHVLPAPHHFDLVDRRIVDPVSALHPGEAADLAAMTKDARRVARQRTKQRPT